MKNVLVLSKCSALYTIIAKYSLLSRLPTNSKGLTSAIAYARTL